MRLIAARVFIRRVRDPSRFAVRPATIAEAQKIRARRLDLRRVPRDRRHHDDPDHRAAERHGEDRRREAEPEGRRQPIEKCDRRVSGD
ncbi:MAG: hypothetical protein AAFW46_13905, partial [Pseudomonadota bacterium]